jgi:hypothetical protein
MKARVVIIGAIAAMALSAGDALSTADTAQAGSCRPDFKPHADNRGNRWSTGWICGNRVGASLYAGAYRVFKVSTMLSNPSWFVCYQRGAWHEGQNNVWYYTKGDRMAPGAGAAGNWGFMPAVDVWTGIDPRPFVRRCS